MMPVGELKDLATRAIRGDDLPIMQLYEVLKDPRVPVEPTLRICCAMAMRACGVGEGLGSVSVAVKVFGHPAPWLPGFQPVMLTFWQMGQSIFVGGYVSKEC